MDKNTVVIAIDHGWSNMKTVHETFTSGIREITTEPALFENVLEKDGKYYKVGTERLKVKDSKVEDENYYLLSLAATAKELMELHLDASIDKLDNLAMNVQIDKEKRIENTKNLKQTEPERAEAERVEAEIVNSPMVAEPQEYQYNADAFEARGADEVKQEASHKEVSKVREDKAR